MPYKNDNTAERRTKLDGGLNTHDSPFNVRPDQVVASSNFRGDGGSLQLRDAAKFLATLSTDVATLPLPAAVILDAGAGGTIPAATYTVRYHLTRWGSASVTGDIGPSSSSNALVLGANRRITIRIFPLNLGGGIGQSSSGTNTIDDPFMGGYSSTQVAVYMQSGAGAFEFQGLKSFTWSVANAAYEHTLTAYVTGQGTSSTENSYLPVRKLFYFDTPRAILGIFGDQAFSMVSSGASGVPGAASLWSREVDKSNNTFFPFSRSPMPIDMVEIGRVVVGTDGFRAKKTEWSPVGATSNVWRLLGATPPDAAPTMALGAAGLPNGVYRYRVTFLYSTRRPVDRTGEIDTWYSESRPTESAGTISPVNQQVVVTFNANRNETGLNSINVYRTVAGGSTFYLIANVSKGSASYTDNIADATITGNKTDPDDEGKVLCDLPPDRLIMVGRLGARCIGVVGQGDAVSSSDQRTITVRGTNQVRVSKPILATYGTVSGGSLVLTDTDAESSIDHFPNDVNHTIVCGSETEITALVPEYRGLTYVFKYNEIGVISGKEPGEFDYDTLYTEIGAIRDSVVNVNGVLFFWSAEMGAFTFDGRSYRWIGLDIKDTWLADRDASPGYYCVNANYDHQSREVRWSFTTAGVNPDTYQLDSTQSNLESVRGLYKEYAYNLDSNSWHPFTSESQTRDVRAVCNARVGYSTSPLALRYRTIIGTTIGTLCMDHETGANAYRDPTDGSSGQTITATATLRVHGLSEDWDFVKKFLYLFITYTTGTVSSGSLTVSGKANESANFVTIGTISTTAVGLKTAMLRIPASLGDNINMDRGLQVKFDSTLNAALSIHAVEMRYRPDTPVKAQVRP